MQARRSQIVLGIDPDPSALWPVAREPEPGASADDTATAGASSAGDSAAAPAARAVVVHCRALIDATADACVAVKPQLVNQYLPVGK